jgi:hypothetical protein
LLGLPVTCVSTLTALVRPCEDVMPDSLPPLESECFFLAPIGSEGSNIRHRSDGVLEFIVDRAAAELGLTAVRADQLADPGQITLQVIEHVINARAVVADLTGSNPNVFYELAVRHAFRRPVVLIVEAESKLPFDIAQMRTIFFNHQDLASADRCRREIVAQLHRAFETGAVDSPIATAIDIQALEGGSALERNVAELLTSVEELSRFQRIQFESMDALRVALEQVREGDSRFKDFPQHLSDLHDDVILMANKGKQRADELNDDWLHRLMAELIDVARAYEPIFDRVLRPGSAGRVAPRAGGSAERAHQSKPSDEST